MKKLILFGTLLASLATHSFPMKYLKTYFSHKQEIATPAPVKAKVGVVIISPELNFYQITKTLIQAAKNKDLLGLILVFDNTGGSTAQFSTLHDLVKKITTIKPIVGLVCGNCLSGAYMVASTTNYLLCAEAANIGSVGVIVELHKISNQRLVGNANNNIDANLDVQIFNEGTYKTTYNQYAPLTDTQRAFIKEDLSKTYQYFINLIATNRNISAENYLDWADAKIFMGYEAVELGLVDGLGTLFDAEDKVLELIKQKSPDITFDTTIETIELN